MKVFAVVSAIVLVILGTITVYLNWQREKERGTQSSAIFKARQEAFLKSQKQAMDAFSKMPMGQPAPHATPMGGPAASVSPAPQTPAPAVLPATPAP